MPRRREALLEIRRLIVDEGPSHTEIQLRLNLAPSTYFRYLDILFKAEQEAISGNDYTYQLLLNETLILGQRYLRRARKLTAMADDDKIDPEQRIEAHKFAVQLERAVHDMSYFSPAYLKNQKLLPEPNSSQPALTMSAVEDEERDPLEGGRIKAAGEFRRERQQQHKQQQEPRFRMVKDPKTQLPTRYEAKEEEE